MGKRFEETWWFGQEEAPQYADSIDPSSVGGENTSAGRRAHAGCRDTIVGERNSASTKSLRP
ncbi:MAG: hypothetical protein M3385_09805 [Actinomycetota bacterium]|nr:hypothetical protein [Actinomycetota bacterium]